MTPAKPILGEDAQAIDRVLPSGMLARGQGHGRGPEAMLTSVPTRRAVEL